MKHQRIEKRLLCEKCKKGYMHSTGDIEEGEYGFGYKHRCDNIFCRHTEIRYDIKYPVKAFFYTEGVIDLLGTDDALCIVKGKVVDMNKELKTLNKGVK